MPSHHSEALNLARRIKNLDRTRGALAHSLPDDSHPIGRARLPVERFGRSNTQPDQPPDIITKQKGIVCSTLSSFVLYAGIGSAPPASQHRVGNTPLEAVTIIGQSPRLGPLLHLHPSSSLTKAKQPTNAFTHTHTLVLWLPKPRPRGACDHRSNPFLTPRFLRNFTQQTLAPRQNLLRARRS